MSTTIHQPFLLPLLHVVVVVSWLCRFYYYYYYLCYYKVKSKRSVHLHPRNHHWNRSAPLQFYYMYLAIVGGWVPQQMCFKLGRWVLAVLLETQIIAIAIISMCIDQTIVIYYFIIRLGDSTRFCHCHTPPPQLHN